MRETPTSGSTSGSVGKRRVAIIGTGLAGLHAAHLLSETSDLRSRFEVHLFEKGQQLGLDGSSISIDGVRIDVPLRSFNAGYYPSLMKLYRKLGVPVRKNNFTFSFATSTQPRSPFLLYNGQNGLRGISLPSKASSMRIPDLIAQLQLLIPIIISYLSLLAFSFFHFLCGHLHDPQHSLTMQPLQSWLDHHPRLLGPIFIDSILLSLFSAMTTSSLVNVQQVPVAEVMLYVAATFLRNHYTIQGGVQVAEAQLVANIPKQNIHTGVVVLKLQPTSQGDKLGGGRGGRLTAYDLSTQSHSTFEGFQDVIFGTPANLSASLLDTYRTSLEESATELEEEDKEECRRESERTRLLQRELGQISYEASTVINHTDRSLLPKSRSDWRDLNLVTSSASSSKSVAGVGCHTMATHVCQRLADNRFVFQTTNPIQSPAPSTILSTSTFSRALTQSKRLQQGLFTWKRSGLLLPGWEMKLGDLQQDQRCGFLPNLWFCGSYSQGIPLLEGCVTSSTLVVREMLRHQK